jgi:hypothetical protein
MSLSKQILIALLAGLALGLFLGERTAFLELPARGFVQLIQVTVLPFVVGSLVAGYRQGYAGPGAPASDAERPGDRAALDHQPGARVPEPAGPAV